MTRRGLLQSLTALLPVGLLSTNQVQKAVSARHNWKAVALIGLDENNVPTVGLYNNSENSVSMALRGVAFQVEKETGDCAIVVVGDQNQTLAPFARFTAPKEGSSAEIKQTHQLSA